MKVLPRRETLTEFEEAPAFLPAKAMDVLPMRATVRGAFFFSRHYERVAASRTV
jgi:hypothetical protein